MTALAPDTWRRLLRRSPADAALARCSARCWPRRRGGWLLGGRPDGAVAGRPDRHASGSSQWISGQDDIVHTHRLRALCDAVVVGAGTVRADDPQLTTRECEGPAPVRVVLDTDRRLERDYGVFREGPRPCCSVPRMRPAPIASARRRCCGCRARGRAGHRGRPRGAGGARAAAHLRRGRRHHRLALPRRRRARPAARDRRAGAARLRHSGLHPAGGGALTDGLRFDWTVHRARRRRAVRHPARPRAAGARHERRAHSGPSRPGMARSATRRCPRRRRTSAGAHAGQRRVARHRALVFAGRVPESQYQAMRAPLMGGRVPISREVRLQRGRPRRRWPARLRAASAPGPLPRAGGDVHPGARCGADTARGAGGQHGDRAEHYWDAAPLAGERCWSSAPAWSGC